MLLTFWYYTHLNTANIICQALLSPLVKRLLIASKGVLLTSIKRHFYHTFYETIPFDKGRMQYV